MSMLKIREEVMRMREIITETTFTNHETETTLLVWVLKKLKSIPIDDIETFKITGIGKVVNHLKKHKSDRVSEIATKLIKKWKAIVCDICAKSTMTTLAPASAAGSAEAAEPNASLKIQLVGKSNLKPAAAAAAAEPDAPISSSRPSLKIRFVVGKSKPQPAAVENNKEIINIQMHQQQQQQQEVIAASAKSLQSKLEMTKRKLDDSYQQFENAKKQRTIKAIDNTDVPKPSRAAEAAGTNSRAMKISKQAAISKRLNMMKRNHLHRSKVLLPY